jgi:hypothetical protein
LRALRKKPRTNAEAQSTLRFAAKKKAEHRAPDLRSTEAGGDVSFLKLACQSSLYLIFAATYTPNGAPVARLPNFYSLRLVCGVIWLCAVGVLSARSQQPASPPAKQSPKSAEAPEKRPELPAQIELLETRVRFETNGDSRKEVHTRVHINDELGARQFARLTFDYNRSFQQIEFALLRITHAGGGTADILPSAIADQRNPAVVNAPAYQDVRVKSVRILGLAPGDLLEYLVITRTAHHALAPNFYVSHDFAREIVVQELFELDLPSSRDVKPLTSAAASDYETSRIGEEDKARVIYRWRRPMPPASERLQRVVELPRLPVESDVVLTTFGAWADFQIALQKSYEKVLQVTPRVKAKAMELTQGSDKQEDQLRAFYDFVSRQIHTIDLPLDATGFRPRPAESILSSSYAAPDEKCILLSALVRSVGLQAEPAFTVSGTYPQTTPAIPSLLRHPLVLARFGDRNIWLDPSVGVAPFGMIASTMRGRPVVPLYPPSDTSFFEEIPLDLPFAGSQGVSVNASVAADGALNAKVKYTMRGDNELLLRVAFHQSPKEKWKEIAQLLALSDGFRGKITNITASDPYATKEPFTVEYEITQPKFVDWSKKPVRIPALLPQVGLPDPPSKTATAASTSAIDLGTPLDVETHLMLGLPAGTSVHTPTGTSVERDYATFASKYQATGGSVTASRHLNFLLRQIPADRAADYNAFVRAVQSDEAQEFTLERRDIPLPSDSAAPAASSKPGPKPPKR